MDNSHIAKQFQLLADLMELHGENSFKIRSYQNAYLSLRKSGDPLHKMELDELEGLPGVGKAIAAKIQEIARTGKLAVLEELKSKTPEGVQELLRIKGLGPKKLRIIWQELGVESIGELQYALLENRLLELKGFGLKTQEELSRQLAFFVANSHQFLFSTAEKEAASLLQSIRSQFPSACADWTGSLRRLDPILEKISLLLDIPNLSVTDLPEEFAHFQQGNGFLHGTSPSGFPVEIYYCAPEEFNRTLFTQTADSDFLQAFNIHSPTALQSPANDESIFFNRAGLPFLSPELREGTRMLQPTLGSKLEMLVSRSAIRGVVHTHSTYSDGIHSIYEMATESQRLGYEYLVISDHSRSAFYANGLSIDRLLIQWQEIEALNAQLSSFRIFKGIECDILTDGGLDYPDAILAQFEVVIASVHSNLKMDEDKATKRLIRAIENPYTRILGHPTGRLLLSRPGYPIRHKEVINACAQHGVAIELNANPYRLDLDYRWIDYAMQKGVLISINPDAHSKTGLQDIRHGVVAARKGGLLNAYCLNAKDTQAFANWLAQKP